MMTLKMLTEDEVNRIFGKLDCLLPLHEDLLSRLEKTRTENGRTDGVGEVFIEWVSFQTSCLATVQCTLTYLFI